VGGVATGIAAAAIFYFSLVTFPALEMALVSVI